MQCRPIAFDILPCLPHRNTLSAIELQMVAKMPSPTYRLIHQAIVEKKNITATYQGHYREMSPHTLGYSKQGVEQALFYQFGGTSSSGLAPPGDPKNWRCIPLDGLSNVLIQAGTWQTGPNHAVPQTCIAEVDIEVAY